MKLFFKIIKYGLSWLWKIIIVCVGAIALFGAWFWPAFVDHEYFIFEEYWIISYGLIVFYSFALWHVVSEDEREVTVWVKMKQGILIAFNKMLYAFLVFGIYILVMEALSEAY